MTDHTRTDIIPVGMIDAVAVTGAIITMGITIVTRMITTGDRSSVMPVEYEEEFQESEDDDGELDDSES